MVGASAYIPGGLANFKSASDVLTVLLVLAVCLYAAPIIFLGGIQIDELLRKDASPHETGIIDLLRCGMGTAR
jgi:hypothetical protein